MKPRVSLATPDAASLSADAQRQGIVAAPALPHWASLYFAASPSERQAWFAEAASSQGVLALRNAAGKPMLTPARLPPASPTLLAQLEGADMPPPMFAVDDPLAEDAVKLCASRVHRANGLFLLRGWTGAELREAVMAAALQALSEGERLLLVSDDAAEGDRLLMALAADARVWPVRLHGPEAPPIPAMAELLPAARKSRFEEEWRRRIHDEAARRHARIAELKAFLAETPAWKEACARCETAQKELERLHSALANQLGALQEEASAPGDARAEWRRQREAELARHEAARKSLVEAEAKAAAEFTDAEAELRKRQQELDTQARLAESRRFPNPLSMTWWRAMTQGRSAARLEECTARRQDAEIQLLSARSQLQIAEENLEVEERRHATALEQIFKAELDRRHADLKAAAAAAQTLLELSLERWRTWLLPSEPELAAAAPSLERLGVLESRWRQALHEAEAAEDAASHSQAEPAALDSDEAFRMLTNLVAVPAGEIAAAEAFAAWSKPGFDRLIVLGADRIPDAVLLSLSTWAGSALLVGSPSLNQGHSGLFESLWRRLRPSGPPLAMRWVRDGDRWHCLWSGLTAETESCLQQEPLADRPDIDLFIINAPDAEPRLAALAFPAEKYTLAAAKQFHAEEMGEFALDPLGAEWRLREEGERLIAEFMGQRPKELEPIPYADGITEWAAPEADPQIPPSESLPSWRTVQLDFSRGAGWTWEKVQEWLSERWRVHDFSRTFELSEASGRHPALVQAALSLRPDLASTLRLSATREERGGGLRWIRSGDGAAKPKPQTIKRLDGGRVTLSPERSLPVFNVGEAKALVHAVEQALSVSHRAAELRDVSAPLKVLFVAPSQPQLDILQRQWPRHDPAAVAVRFALLDEIAGMHAEFVAFCASASSPAADPQRTLDAIAALLLAAERHLLLYGDLTHLLPANLLEPRPDDDAALAEARARLRSFLSLLAAGTPTVTAVPLGATA